MIAAKGLIVESKETNVASHEFSMATGEPVCWKCFATLNSPEADGPCYGPPEIPHEGKHGCYPPITNCDGGCADYAYWYDDPRSKK